MLDSHPARNADGIIDCLNTDWAALCADAPVRPALADWPLTDRPAADAVDPSLPGIPAGLALAGAAGSAVTQ